MELLQLLTTKNSYSGSGWNTELTKRYLFSLNNNILEASYFEHYNNDIFIKKVIELPITYGCLIGCKFCASGNLNGFRKLEFDELLYMYKYIINNEKINNEKILITITGIGELQLMIEEVLAFLNYFKGYMDIEFTFSTIYFNKTVYEFLLKAKKIINIRRFQITYITSIGNQATELIPWFKTHNYDIAETLKYIEKIEEVSFRINYVMIKHINDDEDSFMKFINIFFKVKSKIRVRISILNATPCTRRNKIDKPSNERAIKFQQILENHDFDCYIFQSHYDDNLSCGQLVAEYDT